MKHTLTFLFLALAIATQAQFGVKGGLSMSQYYGSEEWQFTPKANIVAGIYDRIYLSKRISIQPELLYNSKGSLINYETPERPVKGQQYRQNMRYVELPVNVNLHLGDFAIHGGGYVAYLTRMHISKWNYEYTITEQDLNRFHRLDYGLNYGASFDLHGAILQFNGSYGLRIVGKDGQPYGRWGDNKDTDYNAAYSMSLLIPFALRK